MKLLNVAPWIAQVYHNNPWNRIIGHWPLAEPEAILFEWNGMYFLARRAVVANAMDVLAQQKTAQAKNPLPEPSFALCDFPVVPHPFGSILAEELCE